MIKKLINLALKASPLAKKVLSEDKLTSPNNNQINQYHYGQGDNIEGNKIVNNVSQYVFLNLQSVDKSINGDELQIFFENKPKYPFLNFSITNSSNLLIQITSVKIVKAASVKFEERNSLRHYHGPRLKLKIHLENIKKGRWSTIYGDDTVSNLRPMESEPYQLEFECSSTLNLIDIDVEYINPAFNSTVLASSKFMIIVVSSGDMIGTEGEIHIVSREDVLSTILTKKIEKKDFKYFDIDLLYRGAAYISRKNILENWQILYKRFEGSEELGPIIASFGEYYLEHGLPSEILNDLHNFLRNPHLIQSIYTWDNENHNLILFDCLTHHYSKEQKINYIFEVLQNIIHLPTETEDDSVETNNEFYTRTLSIAKKVNYDILVRHLLTILYQIDNDKALGFIYGILRIFPETYIIDSLLNNILKNNSHYRKDEDIIPYWDSFFGIQNLNYSWFEQYSFFNFLFKLAFETNYDELKKASKSSNSIIKWCAIRNNNFPISELENIPSNTEYYIRFFLASSSKCNVKLLAILANDSNSIIRRWVAKNLNTDVSTLKKLSVDKNIKVKEFLVRNPNLPHDLKTKIENKLAKN